MDAFIDTIGNKLNLKLLNFITSSACPYTTLKRSGNFLDYMLCHPYLSLIVLTYV